MIIRDEDGVLEIGALEYAGETALYFVEIAARIALRTALIFLVIGAMWA